MKTSTTAAARTRRRGTLLVVEDQREIRLALRVAAEAQGFVVYEASDGGLALEQTKMVHFDVIVTDVCMPDIDGLRFLEELRLRGVLTPLVFITAYGSKETMLAALRLAAFDLIEKPFKMEVFIQTICRAAQLAAGNPSDGTANESKEAPSELFAAKLVSAELAVARVKALRLASEQFSLRPLQQARRLDLLREELHAEAASILKICRQTLDWLLNGRAESHDVSYLTESIKAIGEAAYDLELPEASHLAAMLVSIVSDVHLLGNPVGGEDRQLIQTAHDELVRMISQPKQRDEQKTSDDILFLLKQLASELSRRLHRQQAEKQLGHPVSQ